MKKKYFLGILCLALFTSSCSDYYDTDNDPIIYGDTYYNIGLKTDKATYKPGEAVFFTLNEKPSGNVKVRFSYLGSVISEENLTSTTWTWTTPSEDYKGYLVDVYEVVGGKEKIYQSIAVDVSSDWKKFPRYGFVSSYGDLSNSQIKKNIEFLNRFHINGVQFYDWMYDHQRPLAGTVDSPWTSWPDLIGRTNYLSTVKGYIAVAHEKGMKAMFYNLAFGALSNAAADGVKEEWYIYKDINHTEKDFHPLDAPFRSSIYLTNPANAEWQNYLIGRNNDVYQVLDFDGYHIDQLGGRGTVYDYNGNEVDLTQTYKSFITAMKTARPDKRLVMNAVSGFGQEESISKSEVDFLYTEIWSESKTFGQLAEVITNNYKYSQNTKSTVLAAYMDYNRSNNTGYVNAPGIYFANAVIFAFGGAHLELGEHYLTNEYFPNENLQMKTDLQKGLTNYYDFLVAYQNLLRDGGNFSAVNVESADGSVAFQDWSGSKGSVAVVGKVFANRDVMHLINFTNASSMEWRDTDGTQTEPTLKTNVAINVTVSKTPSRVWMASPDINGGVAMNLEFTKTGNNITLNLPSLKYWDMIVVEY